MRTGAPSPRGPLRWRFDPAVKWMRLQRRLFYHSAWREAAARLGADVAAIGGGALEIRRGHTAVRVRDNSTPLDDAEALRLAGDKPAVYRRFAEAGVPAPRHCLLGADQTAAAVAFLEAQGCAVVVKPARNTGAGAGVCTGVADPDALRRAMALAGAFCPEVLIEEQLEGDVYRLLMLDGELVDAVIRHPPAAVGDGRSSVLRLVLAENLRRLAQGTARAQSLLAVDGEMRATLAGQGLTLSDRPPAGAQVVLKRVINDNRGEENEAARDLVTPDMLAMARRMAELAGARLAGIDLIRQGDRVTALEVNTTPGYFYHYRCRGGPNRVAVPVLARALGGG